MKVVKRNMSHFVNLWVTLDPASLLCISNQTQAWMNQSMWSVKTMVHHSRLQGRLSQLRWMGALPGWWTWLKLQKACPWTTYSPFTNHVMARTASNMQSWCYWLSLCSLQESECTSLPINKVVSVPSWYNKDFWGLIFGCARTLVGWFTCLLSERMVPDQWVPGCCPTICIFNVFLIWPIHFWSWSLYWWIDELI